MFTNKFIIWSSLEFISPYFIEKKLNGNFEISVERKKIRLLKIERFVNMKFCF
jgi:hypothetical protein